MARQARITGRQEGPGGRVRARVWVAARRKGVPAVLLELTAMLASDFGQLPGDFY